MIAHILEILFQPQLINDGCTRITEHTLACLTPAGKYHVPHNSFSTNGSYLLYGENLPYFSKIIPNIYLHVYYSSIPHNGTYYSKIMPAYIIGTSLASNKHTYMCIHTSCTHSHTQTQAHKHTHTPFTHTCTCTVTLPVVNSNDMSTAAASPDPIPGPKTPATLGSNFYMQGCY